MISKDTIKMKPIYNNLLPSKEVKKDFNTSVSKDKTKKPNKSNRNESNNLELIPESQTNKCKDCMALFTLIGFSVMMILDVALG